MVDLQSIIISDLFSREPNEFLTLIQPIRNASVADQLISTRHMWSDAFNTISSDYSELENILVDITEQVGVLNSRFASKPSENREPYARRQFKVGEFLQFLQSGRNVFRNTLEQVTEYYFKQQQAEKQYYKYPLDPKFKASPNSLMRELPTLFVFKALQNTFGEDAFDIKQSLEIQKMIQDGQVFEPPKIVTVGGAVFTSENVDMVDACIDLEISTIPVLFVDNYAKVTAASTNSKNEFVVDCVRNNKALIEKATSEEFVEFAYHQNYMGEYKKISWIKSNFLDVKEHFENFAKQNKAEIKQLEDAYKNAKSQKLSDDLWKRIEKSQSGSIKQLEDVEKLRKIDNVDYRKIIVEMTNNKQMLMPIVFEKNSKYTLIAGDLRLMICKAMNIQPNIILLKM